METIKNIIGKVGLIMFLAGLILFISFSILIGFGCDISFVFMIILLCSIIVGGIITIISQRNIDDEKE